MNENKKRQLEEIFLFLRVSLFGLSFWQIEMVWVSFQNFWGYGLPLGVYVEGHGFWFGFWMFVLLGSYLTAEWRHLTENVLATLIRFFLFMVGFAATSRLWMVFVGMSVSGVPFGNYCTVYWLEHDYWFLLMFGMFAWAELKHIILFHGEKQNGK